MGQGTLLLVVKPPWMGRLHHPNCLCLVSTVFIMSIIMHAELMGESVALGREEKAVLKVSHYAQSNEISSPRQCTQAAHLPLSLSVSAFVPLAHRYTRVDTHANTEN